MKYRDAKNLQKGDQVIRKSDSASLTIDSTELYGQFKKVKIYYIEENVLNSIFNDEIE